MVRKQKCVAPEVGGKISLEVILPIVEGRKPLPEGPREEPDLSPETRHHLEICESCRLDLRNNLELWYKKAASARKTSQAYAIVNASTSGDPAVLRRNISAGTAFFRPYAGQTRGLFVLVTPDHYIHDPEEKTLEDFNRIS